MRTGENNRDLTTLEKKAGQKAARSIGKHFRSVFSRLTIQQTGDLLKLTTARAKMKFDALDNITIKAPYYAFIQHHGFEGIKSNGVAMSLKGNDAFTIAFNSTKAVEKLADEIGAIRAEEVTSKINW